MIELQLSMLFLERGYGIYCIERNKSTFLSDIKKIMKILKDKGVWIISTFPMLYYSFSYEDKAIDMDSFPFFSVCFCTLTTSIQVLRNSLWNLIAIGSDVEG